MKWLTDIFAGKIIEDAGKLIDNVSTSSEEKASKKNELSKIVFDALGRLGDAQKSVLITELQGSKIQRLWRPVVMIAFASIVVFRYGLYPIAMAFNPELPILPELLPAFWSLLKIGLGGYVVGRSVEKVAETVTKNVDISQLRRKDRKDAMKRQVEEGED